jgi:ribosome maturation factor RimP
MGRLIEVKLFSPVNGKKVIEGILRGYTSDKIKIEINGKEVELEKSTIALAKPVIEF